MQNPWRITEDVKPISFVPVQSTTATSETLLPEQWRDQVVIDTLHDGELIPAEIARSPRVAPLLTDGSMYEDCSLRRDWGANMVATELAAALGLDGHLSVNVARAVMDFNRFPGSSPPETPHTRRFAISGRLAEVLSHSEKRHILETYYDAVSVGMERAIEGAKIKLAIHTYDEHNSTRTRRPEVSLLSRSESYQLDSRLPAGIFDPLFPDQLAESSTNRLLRDRVALIVEKAGYYVEHNYPYLLPDGSLEIRCQPWFFFRFLKRVFEQTQPEAASNPALVQVWEMLLNTNLRHPRSAALAGYLHRFLRAPEGREKQFKGSRAAYDQICDFLATRPDLVSEYSHSQERVSALTIEVRKDLLWEFDGSTPIRPKTDHVRRIAAAIARAVRTFIVEDWAGPKYLPLV